MNEVGAASWITLALIIIFTIINLKLYHKIFHVVYFDLGQGLFREIFYSAIIAFFEAGIVIKLFSGVIGVIGKVILLLLKLLLILVVVAIIAGIIWKIIQVVQGKNGTENIFDNLRKRKKKDISDNKAAMNVCKKCGKEFSADEKNCVYCGEKLEQESENTDKQTLNDSQIKEASEIKQQKKLDKKFLFGALALAIVIIIIAINWEGTIDYEKTVGAHQPFANSQGLPYTYEEVIEKYITSPKWEVRESGDVHYVDIIGKVSGTDCELGITIKIVPDEMDSELVYMTPELVTIDGEISLPENDATKFLYAMFVAYDEGENNIAVLLDLIKDSEMQEEVALTEYYTNEIEGLSFNYPMGWIILEKDSEYEVVEMIDSKNNADSVAIFRVSRILDQNPYGVFTEDETTIQNNINEYGEFLGLWDTTIGDVPVKCLMFQTESWNGESIERRYLYRNGHEDEIYQIACSYNVSSAGVYEQIFDGIMASYVITTATAQMDHVTSDTDICFNGILISELLNSSSAELVQMFGGDYNADGNGRIAYNEIEFYMLNDETVDTIWSFSPEYFMARGYTLDINLDYVVTEDEIVELLGHDFEEEWSERGYYITYDYPVYTISFGINKYSEVSDIVICNKNSVSVGNSAFGANETMGKYYELSGTYSGSMEGSVLGLSIYSSREDNEVSIGNVEIYVGNEYHYFGEIIATEGNVYTVITETGEEVLLVESMTDGTIVLQLYVNGQYIEEYKMEEHYEF